MSFLKKLFSGGGNDVQVTIWEKENLLGKKEMEDPNHLVALILHNLNEHPEKIATEIREKITKGKFAVKNVRMEKNMDQGGTDVTYTLKFS